MVVWYRRGGACLDFKVSTQKNFDFDLFLMQSIPTTNCCQRPKNAILPLSPSQEEVGYPHLSIVRNHTPKKQNTMRVQRSGHEFDPCFPLFSPPPPSPNTQKNRRPSPLLARSTGGPGERRHAGREATRGREGEVWQRCAAGPRRGKRQTPDRRAIATRQRWRERQAARARGARRQDGHRRGAGPDGAGNGRGEGREGLVGSRTGRREGGEAGGEAGAGGTADAGTSWGTTARGGKHAGHGWEAWGWDAAGEGGREGHAGWGKGAGSAARLVVWEHGVVVGLALCCVGGGDGVDD